MKRHSLFFAVTLMLACFSSSVVSARPVQQFILPDPDSGSSAAVVVGESVSLAHTAQIFPLNRRGHLVATNLLGQVNWVLLNLDAVLKTAGSSLDQIVKLNVYLAEEDLMPQVRRALATGFSGETKPAVSFVAGKLAEPRALVAMDAVAVSAIETEGVKNFWTAVASPSDAESAQEERKQGIASAAILPAGSKLYVSGMADTNRLAPATRKTLEKLVAAIGHLGSQPSDIVQLKVFLQPMLDIAAVRKEVADFFGGKAPPTAFVEWINANPPVEIELIAAARGDFSKEIRTVSYLTPPGTTSAKVYSRVARVNHGKQIYISGLYGLKSSDAAGQVREIFGSLRGILEKTGSDFEHLVKATYYVTDDDASRQLNTLRPEYYNPERPPAASKAKVKSVGVPGKTVTVDMIAVTR